MEYAIFAAMAKENCVSGLSLEKTAAKAVDECIEKGILKDYFTEHSLDNYGIKQSIKQKTSIRNPIVMILMDACFSDITLFEPLQAVLPVVSLLRH